MAKAKSSMTGIWGPGLPFFRSTGAGGWLFVALAVWGLLCAPPWGAGDAVAHTPEEKAYYLQSRIVLRLNPADLRAGLAVGVWHLEYKDPARAREAFHGVLAHHPGHFVAKTGLALLEEVEHRPQEALDLIREAVENPGEGARDLIGFLLLVRGRLLVRLGQFEAAGEVLTQSLAEGGHAHDVYFWQGRIEEVSGRIGKAIGFYRQAIAADPSWPESYARLSALLQRQGKTGKAMAVLEQVLELQNPSPYPNNDIRVLWRWVMRPKSG